MPGQPGTHLNQHQQWALRRLRSKVFHASGPELGVIYDVLEANLLRTPPSDVNERARVLLRRVAKKARLSKIERPRMAHELVPTLLDGLEHPDAELRRLAASQFAVASQANAFWPPPSFHNEHCDRFDKSALRRSLKALTGRMNQDVDEIAIEASRQLWLLVRFHARTGHSWGDPLENMYGWNVIDPDRRRLKFLRRFGHWTLDRPEPHPHIVFFAECTRVSLINAEVPGGAVHFEAPQWPPLTPLLPDISQPFTHFDHDHETQTLTCSFERVAPRPAKLTRSSRACGVCSARNAILLAKEEDSGYSYRITTLDLECEVCGCFSRHHEFERMD